MKDKAEDAIGHILHRRKIVCFKQEAALEILQFKLMFACKILYV